MRKRYVLKNRNRFLTFISVLIIMAFMTISVTSVYASRGEAGSSRKIIVSKGDTLWDIARQYHKNGDVRKFIYQIKKMNHLNSSEIFEGDELIIPD